MAPIPRTILGRMTRSLPNRCHFSRIMMTPKKKFFLFFQTLMKKIWLHTSTRVQLLKALFQKYQPRFSGPARQGHTDHPLGVKTKARGAGLEPLEQPGRLNRRLRMKRQEHLQTT